MNIKLLPGERLDELHRKGYLLIQKENGFCFGLDAVLLTAFTKVKPGEHALDLGSGTGIIPILLEAKTKGSFFTGLEIQEDLADMANRSICLNHLEDKISIKYGDIKGASKQFGASSFDVVTTNPPYMAVNQGLTNANPSKMISRHEILCKLSELIRESSSLLRPNGRFYMVHRPHRLVEIISLMQEYKLEPKRMQFVHSFINKEPVMVLIEGLRGGNRNMRIEKPLIVYESNGHYTKDIIEIYGYESNEPSNRGAL